MDNLKKLRKRHKISQKEFAEKMNVAQNTVSRWENGERLMDSETLIKAASFFNVSVDYLLGLAGNDLNISSYKKTADGARLINEYNKLNDMGKREAIKRVKELTLIPVYCNSDMPIAAHNDAEITDEELKLMQKDIDEL